MGRKALPTDEMNLTVREHRMLDFLKETIVQKGYPPTVREIGRYLGVKSTSTVHKDLASLQKKGFIVRDPLKPRTIELVGFDRLGENRAGAGPERKNAVDVPVVGRVAAGTPLLAEQNISEFFPVPAGFITGEEEHFMLTVRGESMIEAGIMDGDYILVRRQNTAENGQIVVAMIDGFESEATVKTYYKEKNHIRLQPENSSMSPILVRDVHILGLVKGVFRYM